MSRKTSQGLRQDVGRLAPRIVGWRRDLHRQPELGFEEHCTAQYVAERLAEIGVEERRTLAGTGLVGLLRARSPRGPAVLLRADMDALPIQEVEGRQYGSRNAGRMHACGHDGHMAMLLGASALLAARREELSRDVVLCFQPGEEGFGGAERMIEEGVLDWVETGSVYALHLWTPFPAGTLNVRSGPTMAAADEFEARILGCGGHGALPHHAVDPLVAAALAVTALQSVVSRSIDPLEPSVVTVGSFQAGVACNVIPSEARLLGTMRSFSPSVREDLKRRVREVLLGTCAAAGCRLEFHLRGGYPATVNDSVAVEIVRQAGQEVFGAAGVREPAPLAAAEDFSFFLERRPGAFVLVGAGNEERGITAPHHSAEFDIDETVLPLGAELLARLALSESQPGR